MEVPLRMPARMAGLACCRGLYRLKAVAGRQGQNVLLAMPPAGSCSPGFHRTKPVGSREGSFGRSPPPVVWLTNRQQGRSSAEKRRCHWSVIYSESYLPLANNEHL